MMIEKESICLHCGFCCDGTLFVHALIHNHELISSNFNFEVRKISKLKSAFSLPCTYLKSKSCSIYKSRPYAICERFKCKLLNHVTQNIISFQRAIDIVKLTEDLVRNFNKEFDINFPEFTDLSTKRKLTLFNQRETDAGENVGFTKKYAQLKFDSMLLNRQYHKHFINR